MSNEIEIDLPEIYYSPEWKKANPDADPMEVIEPVLLAVLLENNRKLTIIRPIADEDTESQKMRTCAMDLPLHPNVLRSVVDGHDDVEAFIHGNQLVLVSDGNWHTEDLHRFYEWRGAARNILNMYYPDLWKKLSEQKDGTLSMTQDGISFNLNGVELSAYYRPEEIVSKAIAAQAIGEKLVFNETEIRLSDEDTIKIVLPEITGNITFEMMAEYFNGTLKNLIPKLSENGLFTAFFARSSTGDGIDIVSVLPNGMGGYVNLSTYLAMYLYGNKQMQPVLKVEGDMIVVSHEDTDAFVPASVAYWIDYERFANENNLC